jgi:3-oxoadipate enol-lactonase
MPHVTIHDKSRLYVRDESSVDPWAPERPVVVMVHGMAETSVAWFAWVPHFLREYRVVRVDLRGLGESDIPRAGYSWSVDGFVADIASMLEIMGIASAHLIGAKLGGAICLSFAAQHPEITRSVTVIGPIVRADRSGKLHWLRIGDSREADTAKLGDAHREEITRSMRARLGDDVSVGQLEWWVDMYCRTNRRVMAEVVDAAQRIDIEPELRNISAPALAIIAEHGALHSPADMKRWIDQIPHGRLEVWPGSGFHLAAIAPDQCATRALEFVRDADQRSEGV